MDNLYQTIHGLIGRRLDSTEVAQFFLGNRIPPPDIYPELRKIGIYGVDLKRRGFSLKFGNRPFIDRYRLPFEATSEGSYLVACKFHPEGHLKFKQFKDELPFGLRFDVDLPGLVRLLGKPGEMLEDGKERSAIWHLEDRGLSLWVQHDVAPGGRRSITTALLHFPYRDVA